EIGSSIRPTKQLCSGLSKGRRPVASEHALWRVQVLQRRQRTHLLSGLWSVERRSQALDNLWSGPRFRHDQRTDEGNHIACPRPPFVVCVKQACDHFRMLRDLSRLDTTDLDG